MVKGCINTNFKKIILVLNNMQKKNYVKEKQKYIVQKKNWKIPQSWAEMKLRLSVAPKNIETGRNERLNVFDKVCSVCNNHEIKDENMLSQIKVYIVG